MTLSSLSRHNRSSHFEQTVTSPVSSPVTPQSSQDLECAKKIFANQSSSDLPMSSTLSGAKRSFKTLNDSNPFPVEQRNALARSSRPSNQTLQQKTLLHKKFLKTLYIATNQSMGMDEFLSDLNLAMDPLTVK